MSLRDRLEGNGNADISANGAVAGISLDIRSSDNRAYRELKTRVHGILLDRIDLQVMERLSQAQLMNELKNLVEELLSEENVVVNDVERKNIVRDIQFEMFGLGPLELLMADPNVSDILVNTYKQVYVERFGKLELTDICFNDNAHLMKIIDKIVSRVGRRVDESSPMVDARLPDGSRVNVIIPPLAIDGPIMSVRRFALKALTMDDCIRFQSLTPAMAQVLQGLVQAKVNMIISGGTGGGKTTLLNILSSYIGAAERVVTIEDAAELQMQQPHVVRLETRPPNIEGKGEITQRALVRNALRMRPDRIIVGEVRSAEAIDMLQAMNTGHEGSLATIHSNTPRDALTRLENMLGLAGMNLPSKVMRHQISSAITVVIQVARLSDGKRKVVSIQEITGMEGDTITMQEIFGFRQTGLTANGAVAGYFCATGVRPGFSERLHVHGIDLPDALFDPVRLYEIKT
ncbi:CpaF family protein [Undibacterium sp.]|jgi:pilus assembly protein CpaF|uniref:CpaF family protein n=1 Tax=Undibacterium sp. TaxID=1914977 RepID=UPI002BDA7096|nr:CpaF family protein [Undibacterium sp.]HTD04526.1 CpaF family protein [Undibacterium sp.]